MKKWTKKRIKWKKKGRKKVGKKGKEGPKKFCLVSSRDGPRNWFFTWELSREIVTKLRPEKNQILSTHQRKRKWKKMKENERKWRKMKENEGKMKGKWMENERKMKEKWKKTISKKMKRGKMTKNEKWKKEKKREEKMKKWKTSKKKKWKYEKEEKWRNMKKFGFTSKILDDFQGLPLLLSLFSTKSSTISMILFRNVSTSRGKSTTRFGWSPFFSWEMWQFSLDVKQKHTFYQRTNR